MICVFFYCLKTLIDRHFTLANGKLICRKWYISIQVNKIKVAAYSF